MGLAPFFDRVAASAGGNLTISRQSLEERLREVVPSVITGPSLEGNALWTAELLVNLLSRLYPRIAIFGPQALVDLAVSVNPAITLENREGPSEYTVSMADSPPAGGLAAGACGWTASVTVDGSVALSGPPNPYSSGAAACVAASEVFRRVFGLPRMKRSWQLSLLDYTEGTSDIPLSALSLSDVALVGLGAIAHGAFWAIHRHVDRQGFVHLVDDESLELSNLQRYVCAFSKDVSLPKAAIALRELESSTFKCETHFCSFEQFALDTKGSKLRTICVSVDNIAGRRAVQASLPELVLNAYTGIGSLGVSSHGLDGTTACLACLYHPNKPSPGYADMVAEAFGLDLKRTVLLLSSDNPLPREDLEKVATKLGLGADMIKHWSGKPLRMLYTQVICGGASLPTQVRGRSEIVPLAHQSALAGILLAAELVKANSPTLCSHKQKQPLIAWHDVRRPPPRNWTEPRAAVPGCICGDHVYRQVYRNKWRTN